MSYNASTDSATKLITLLIDNNATIAVAESLTGGALCGRLVDVPGASKALHGAVCTYTTEMKHKILSVSAELLAAYGPVHPQIASEMAFGVQRLFNSTLALATTGVAGPGSADGHPAGTVYIACVAGHHVHVKEFHFEGDRNTVRHNTINAAITLAIESLPHIASNPQ